VPRKNFYAFKAFRALLDTPMRVKTPPCEAGRIAFCAGLNSEGTRAAILLSNFDTIDQAPDLMVRGLPWSEATRFEWHLVDGHNDFQLSRRGTLPADGRLGLADVKAPIVALVRLSPDGT